MLGDPPAALLVAEARRALEEGLAPGFPQKVAANALGIAQRELELGPALADEERGRLNALIGVRDDLARANAKLCAAIRSGECAMEDPRLLNHLIRSAVASLSVDQPGYPAFKAWLRASEDSKRRTEWRSRPGLPRCSASRPPS